MRIGTLGAGNMAEALAGRWVAAGHEVTVGARSPEKAAALAGKIGATAGTLREAAAFGDAVLLAVPFAVAEEVLREAAVPAGRTLIDCTNPVVPPEMALLTAGGPSAAERCAAAAPGAHVVKAFNVCHEGIWRTTPPQPDGRPLGVPLCGDDAAAVAAVEQLVRDLDCEPLNGGGLARAGQLEATAAFVIGLWFGGGDPASMLPPVGVAMGGEPHVA
ncbi:NADPH-dependent F420 reductase [Actinomadura hibisca]|uniref:NADPH-dependent F420 reductase n=1 Tax=Actinomadura hibisca TaxID=68565 RepID=UPI000832B381|nr:NAD(P)-binding domain-containing protein [Actinomadura hibisca]